jgi:methyl-accepting chemotaxis protein
LRRDFNLTLERLTETISQVVETAESIRARSTELSRASDGKALARGQVRLANIDPAQLGG